MPPTAQRIMRRSCQFCRSRKIRCTGQDKCDACRDRNIDCIYGREASKGRPRRSNLASSVEALLETAQAATSSSLRTSQVGVDMGSLSTTLFLPTSHSSDPASAILFGNGDDASESRDKSWRVVSRDTHRATSSSDDLEQSVPGSGPSTPAQEPTEEVSLASELELMFRQNFDPSSAGKEQVNMYQEAISKFTKQARRMEQRPEGESPGLSTVNSSGGEFKCAVMSYDAIFSLLTQELVEILVLKYGRLGCHHLGDTNATFYIKCLAGDDTPCMFPDPIAPVARNPFNQFDLHRTLQLIDIWFSVHPLATVVSKTLLLRQYRSNTHDPMLLSLIIADALYIGDGKVANAQAEEFFNHATSLLHSKSIRSCTLSTAQAFTLFGWHELCLAKARRATCFMGYACRIATKLMARAAHVPATGLSRINGIDAGEVEVELMHNTYWLILSTTIWGFMQFDCPVKDLLPSPLTMTFPPVNHESSIVYKLDSVSGNISTFHRQARMVRELWVLSQITSIVGHVYSLFPRNPTNPAELPSSLSWQARPLQRLRLLSNPQQDIIILCSRIREILREAAKNVTPERVTSFTSQAALLSTYHTIIIHLLFPRISHAFNSDGNEYALTTNILDTFAQSVRALVELSTRFRKDEFVIGSDKVLYSTGSTADPGFSMTANMFILSLDACARTLAVYHRRLKTSVAHNERAMLMTRRAEFALLTAELHDVTKIERLNIARRVRAVKKYLKAVKIELENMPNDKMGDSTLTPAPLDGGRSAQSLHDTHSHLNQPIAYAQDGTLNKQHTPQSFSRAGSTFSDRQQHVGHSQQEFVADSSSQPANSPAYSLEAMAGAPANIPTPTPNALDYQQQNLFPNNSMSDGQLDLENFPAYMLFVNMGSYSISDEMSQEHGGGEQHFGSMGNNYESMGYWSMDDFDRMND